MQYIIRWNHKEILNGYKRLNRIIYFWDYYDIWKGLFLKEQRDWII